MPPAIAAAAPNQATAGRRETVASKAGAGWAGAAWRRAGGEGPPKGKGDTCDKPARSARAGGEEVRGQCKLGLHR